MQNILLRVLLWCGVCCGSPLWASTSFLNPTLLQFEQPVDIELTAEQPEQYFAIDLPGGVPVSVGAELINQTNYFAVQNVRIYFPENAPGAPTLTAKTGKAAVDLAGHRAGRYVFEVKGSLGRSRLEIRRPHYVTGSAAPVWGATPLTSRYLQTSNGELDVSLRYNYYHFYAEQGEQVSFDATGIQTDVYLEIFGKKSEIALPSVYLGMSPQLQFTAPASGIYLARFSQFTYRNASSAPLKIPMNVQGVRPEADTDGDGLSDAVESLRGSDPLQADSNHDGITDDVAAKSNLPGLYRAEFSAAALAAATSPATAIALPYLNAPVQLNAVSEQPVYFSVDLAAGENIVVSSTATLTGSDLYFSSGSAFLQALDADTGLVYDQQFGHYQALAAGRYYVKVQPKGLLTFGVYRSFANPGTSDADRKEYNNNALSRLLQSGSVLIDRENRFFRFTAKAGQKIVLEMSGHNNESDPYFGPDFPGKVQGQSTADGRTMRYEIMPYRTGVYFMQTQTLEMARCNITVTGTMAEDPDEDGLSSELEIALGSDPENADTNRDGVQDGEALRLGRPLVFPVELGVAAMAAHRTPETALSLPAFNQQLGYQLSDGSRYLKFRLTAGQPVTFFMISAPQNSSHKLYGPDGRELPYFISQSADFMPQQTGDYWLELNSGGDGGPKKGDIGVYQMFGAQGQSLNHQQLTSSFMQAPDLQSRQQIMSVANFGGIRFQFTVAAGAQLNLQLDALYGAVFRDLSVNLYKQQPYGHQLQFDPYGEVLNSGHSATYRRTFRDAGAYYLEVRTANPVQLTATGFLVSQDQDADQLHDADEILIGSNWLAADTDQNGRNDAAELVQGRRPQFRHQFSAAQTAAANTLARALTLPAKDQKMLFDVVEGAAVWLAVPMSAGEQLTAWHRKMDPAKWIGAEFSWFNSLGQQLQSGEQFKAPASATYYLKADIRSGTGSLQLGLYQPRQQAGVYDDQRDLYASFDLARQLVSGNYVIPEYNEYYSFRVKAGQRATVTVSTDRGGSPDPHDSVVLYSRDRHNPAQWAAIDEQRYEKDRPAQLTMTPDADLEYVLELKGPNQLEVIVSGIELPQFSLTSNVSPAGSGTVSCSVNPVAYGGSSSCQATAARGFAFSHWSGACSGSQSCELSDVRRPQAVQAVFKSLQNVTASVAGNNRGGTVDQLTQQVAEGGKVRFRLTAASGYRVNRLVAGSCPAGQWLDAVTYETGAVTTGCSVEFSFVKVSRGLPWWLLQQAASQPAG